MRSSKNYLDDKFYAQLSEPVAKILSSIRDSVSQGFCLSDEEGMIRDANQTFASWLGYDRPFFIHRPLANFVTDEERPLVQMYQQSFLLGNERSLPSRWNFENSQGGIVALEVVSSMISCDDLSLRMDILLKPDQAILADETRQQWELDNRHLFKNTLHEIASLLQIQASHLYGASKDLFRAAQKRNLIISAAYEQLYHYADPHKIELGQYLAKVMEIHQLPSHTLADHPEIYVNIGNAYALGLIVNEILSSTSNLQNLLIVIKANASQYRMRILSEDHAVLEPNALSSKLISVLKRQIDAEYTQISQAGVLAELKIPLT